MRYHFVLLIVAAITAVAASEKRKPTSVAELFSTAENLEIVSHADKVDACALRYIPPSEDHSIREERYEETEYIAVPDAAAAAMRTALLRESNYEWNSAKACWPRYHTRLRFHRGEKTVSIDFCFSCEILLIHRDGTVVGGEDFVDHIFLESMRKLFPNDPALKEDK